MLLFIACGGRGVNAVGADLANEIRRVDSPLIAKVDFTPADMVDEAAIRVVLREGATRPDALSVLCEIVGPLIAAADPPAPIGTAAYAWDEVTVLGNGPADCPRWTST
jgi:hypothetical protein